MKTTTLFILLLTIISAQAQVRISGKILDETGTPIAYANIYVPDTQAGVFSRPDGTFDITIPDSLSQSVLEITYLGYAKQSFGLAELKDHENEISLLPLDIRLTEIIVKPKPFKTITVGDKNKELDLKMRGSLFDWNHIYRIALFVANTDNKEGFIESASFFIVKDPTIKKGHQTPFRIRVYDVGENGEPGNDLLLVHLVTQAEKKSEWHTVDLSKYKIPIPENGFFVAMEWLYSKDKKYRKKIRFRMENEDGTITIEKWTAFGQMLGLRKRNARKEDATTWGCLGDEWTKGCCKGKEGKICYDAMISVRLRVQE